MRAENQRDVSENLSFFPGEPEEKMTLLGHQYIITLKRS